MIRIVIEAETVEEALKEARLIGKAPDPSYITIRDQTFPLVPAEIPDEGILTENTSPPVEPIDKGDGVTEFRPVIPDREAVAAANQPPPPTISAIDALPQAPPPPAADVDARGIPWDARIHAGNKATTKDGSWKRRRGVSVEDVQRIEKESSLYVNCGQPPTTSTAPNPSSTAHTMQAPPPPPAPAELPGTEPPPVTFDQLMREAGQRNLGITNLNALTAEVTGGQIGQIALIADKPAYIQAVYDCMAAS